MPVASAAQDSIFDIMDEKYITDISELPYSSGNPVVVWQESKYRHIRAWVDIVGFRNLSKNGEEYFINGDPVNMAIVQYDAKAMVSGSVQELTPTLTITTNNNYTVASLTVYLYWETMQCYDGDCWEVPHHETATFQDVEVAPKQINKTRNTNIEVTVKEQNFTIINTTEISIKIDNMVYDRYLIKTNNGFYEKVNRVWHVESTPKGIYFANESIIDIFKSDNLGHIQDSIIISDLNFNVTASGFYFSTNQTNITKISHTSDPMAQFMNRDLIGFLMILSAFCVFIVYTSRQFI